MFKVWFEGGNQAHLRNTLRMMSEMSIMNDEVYNHYVNGMTPAEIAEHLRDTIPEFGDVDVEEFLIQQESALLGFQNNDHRRDMINDYGQPSSRNLQSELETVSSHFESQLALDEDFARSLELGEDFDSLDVPENGDDNSGPSSRESPVVGDNQNTHQDGFDPDTMTYEELQTLGESVGNESRGLSPNIIARLPTFKYKAGFFSKKKKEPEECVICYAEYKNRSELIILPCAHHYHSKCITHWLRLNKNCPVCQKEVQDE
ncbi:E3 ubiquitin ligase BIG BROTHER-related-like isoform X1 [Primulina huaijiensis]|uniref:E3 ubiquitin ligase BIG BROTHER-related-like isoform X1 n=2 Tax=Primulina huaijiensis TaxID=1492673 RepID=UPI003CC76194